MTNFANKYTTRLSAYLEDDALTCTVDSVVGDPAVPYNAIIARKGAFPDEIVTVTDVTGSVLTITRAAEAVAGVQTAYDHPVGATFTAILTAGAVAAAIAAGVAITDLPAVTIPYGTDELVVNQGGTTKKATLEQVATGYRSGHSVLRDECFFTATTDVHAGGIVQQVGGSGAATSSGGSVAGHPGVLTLAAGTAATGRCALTPPAGNEIAFGVYGVRFGATAKLPTLSDTTVTYTARLGFGDGVAGTDFVDALGFRYTDGVNSGKWQAYALSNSGDTAADTGVAADTGWHLYECAVNAGATQALFYIDHALVATISSGIPTGTTRSLLFIPALIRKSVDATAANRTLLLDHYYYVLETADPRP